MVEIKKVLGSHFIIIRTVGTLSGLVCVCCHWYRAGQVDLSQLRTYSPCVYVGVVQASSCWCFIAAIIPSLTYYVLWCSNKEGGVGGGGRLLLFHWEVIESVRCLSGYVRS